MLTHQKKNYFRYKLNYITLLPMMLIFLFYVNVHCTCDYHHNHNLRQKIIVKKKLDKKMSLQMLNPCLERRLLATKVRKREVDILLH
jgi:hypothetical protein